MKNLSNKIYAFLAKGNNRRVVKIIDAAVIGVLSLITLYFVFRLLSTSTATEYAKTVLHYGLFMLIFGLIDFLIILFTKPLFGFTSFFENRNARRTLKAREKAAADEIERQAQATLKAARMARKAAEKREK